MVEAAEVFDFAVGQPACQVAGFVEASLGKGVGTNFSAVNSGRLRVAAGDLNPADAQLTGDSDGLGVALRSMT